MFRETPAMSSGRLQTLIAQLRRVVEAPANGALTDAELLARWVTARDEAAFEVLLWRHGPMVLSVCRRLLSCPHAADDAFQATFLALVRKAGSINKREAVSSWLYKVAYRAALRAGGRGGQAITNDPRRLPAVAVEPGDELIWRDLRPVLDEEVERLPERYRAPVILCYFQGKTNEEAAREIGCPTGTILSRLARARERLRVRLTRRGIALSTAALGAKLGQSAASALVPAPLASSTIRAALLTAAGNSATAAGVSLPVAALTEGVLQAMLITKLKTVAGVVLALGMLGVGGGALGYRTLAGEGNGAPKPGEPAAKAAQAGPKAAGEGKQLLADDLRDEARRLRDALQAERDRAAELAKLAEEVKARLNAKNAQAEDLAVALREQAAVLEKRLRETQDQLAAQKAETKRVMEKAEVALQQAEQKIAYLERARGQRAPEPPADLVENARDEVELQEAQLQVKHAQLMAAKSALDAGKARYDQMMKLAQSKAISTVEIAEAQAAYAGMEGQYRVRTAELVEQEVRLKQAQRRLAKLQRPANQTGVPLNDERLLRLLDLEKKVDSIRQELEALRRALRPQAPASGEKKSP
jgi:RNA polymerase sigma factor (sigma-70 family)